MAKCGSCTAYHSIDRSTRSTAAGYLSAALETAYKHAGNRLAYESHVRKPGNAETKIKGSHVKRDLRDADTGYDHVERTSDRTGKTSMYHALPNEYRKRLNRRELKFNSSAYKIRDQVEASFDAVNHYIIFFRIVKTKHRRNFYSSYAFMFSVIDTILRLLYFTLKYSYRII